MATKPAYSPGAQVEHAKFGLGSVVSCTDEYIVIKFDDHGEKKFISSMALPSLKKSDRQPPVEKRASRARKKVAATAPPAAPAPAAAEE
jgi:hypothetical protein